MVVKDCEGKGGIAMLWRRGVDVTLWNVSKYHIDMDVKEDDGREWRFTGAYGEPQTELRDCTLANIEGPNYGAHKAMAVSGRFQ
jgi:hypothetical protein